MTPLEGVRIIEPDVFSDDRGWFMESYTANKFRKIGIDVDFVQDNHSFSKTKGVVRGLHFQNDPMAQSKLVRCTNGSIMDVVVDLTKGSQQYLQWLSVELSAENKRLLFIPKGYAHGFLTLMDGTEVLYKVDTFYNKDYDRSIRFDDPNIGIVWGIEDPIVSEKDLKAPRLVDSDCNFSR